LTRNELIDEQNRLNKIRADLDAKEFKEKTLPALRGMVGKTFVYRRSCYSCPQKKSDYWDVFRRVLAVFPQSGGANIVFREVYIDSHGSATIRTGNDYGWAAAPFSGGWSACSSREYDAMHARAARAVVNGRTVINRLRAEKA
jgi:hypothetical protein